MVGTQALEQAALEAWQAVGVTSLGIFNCRYIEGTQRWSLHAEGRALDLATGEAGYEMGAQLLDALSEGAWELGLQRVIFRGHIYDATSPAGRPFYDGGAHDGHLHIEQTREGARDLSTSTARRLLPPSSAQTEDDQVDHIVRWGGLWIVAQDLSTKTPLASTADVQALQASGRYRLTALTAAQMVKIPTADAVHDGDADAP